MEVNSSNLDLVIEANTSILIGQNSKDSRKLKGWIDEVDSLFYVYIFYHLDLYVQVAVWNNVVNISNIYNKYQDPSSDLALVLYLP